MNKTRFSIGLCLASLLSTSAYAQQSSSDQISRQGIALPKFQVTIRSSIDSRVQQLMVEEGSWVGQGDMLIELDSSAAKARKRIAELQSKATGDLRRAEAEVAFASTQLARMESLYRKHATHASEYEAARLRFLSAQAALDVQKETRLANEARVELADAELQQFLIQAPFAGQIVQVHSTVGQSVTPDDDLLQLVSLDRFRVELFLPIERGSELQVGGRYPMKIESPSVQTIEAVLVYRSPVAFAAIGSFRCVFEIDNRELQLPAGLPVSLDLSAARQRPAVAEVLAN